MIIGIISDIHGYLSEKACEALEGVDRILCAGDCENPQIIWRLESIAPTIAVMGNCDRRLYPTLQLNATVSPTFEGVKFFMTHRPEDIGTPAKDVQVVVHGHTHVPRDETRRGVRYINPGSPTLPRRHSDPSVAIMEVSNGEIERFEFVSLGKYPSF